jgi:uncharacterized membrane protein HdeD (DUF308 family)
MAAGEQVQLGKGWWAIVAIGVLSVAAGVMALVWPHITLLTLALITGINLMLLGGLAIGEAIADDEADDRTLRIILGVVGIVAGIVVVRRPGETILVLVLAAGIWLALSGVLQVVGALLVPGGRLLRLLGGVVDVALGVLILSLPKVSLATLAALVGLAFIVRGVLLVAGGWRLRHISSAPAPGSSATPSAPLTA